MLWILWNPVDFWLIARVVVYGSFQVLAGNLGEQAYTVGDKKFQHEPLELKHVLEALKVGCMLYTMINFRNTKYQPSPCLQKAHCSLQSVKKHNFAFLLPFL